MRDSRRSMLHANNFGHSPSTSGARCPATQTSTLTAVRPRSESSFLFKLSKDNYELKIAPHGSELHDQAAHLLARRYAAKGLYPPSFQAERKRYEHTLVACRGKDVVGTLTVGLDSSLGLLADTLYRPQINQVRTQAVKLCELTRLAIDQQLQEPSLPSAIFTMGYLLSRVQHGMTDCLIEVHPRHVAYYARNFGYSIAGPEMTCPRVGAPAVLLHATLKQAESRLIHGQGLRGFSAPMFIEHLKEHSARVRCSPQSVPQAI